MNVKTSNFGPALISSSAFARFVIAALSICLCLIANAPIKAEQPGSASPIVIGLDADFTGPAKDGAIALKQGAIVAMAEINAAGGVLGRPLRLEVTDHRANPRRGLVNFQTLATTHQAVAVLTGVHSPVAIAQLAPAHALGVPIISPWAAATPFISNDFSPNFAFRVSIRDAHAAGFMVGEAIKRGHRRIAILLENTPWGVSNERGLRKAIEDSGVAELVGDAWFAFGSTDVAPLVRALLGHQPDVIIMVANPREGGAILKVMAKVNPADRAPIMSHWGVAAGDIQTLSDGQASVLDFEILQTFSFFDPYDTSVAARVMALTCEMFDVCQPGDVVSHTGISHSYDSIHLIARAIEDAGTADPRMVRDSLEQGTNYRGLVRHYRSSFSPRRHEALNRADFRLVRVTETGRLRPETSSMIKYGTQ